MLNRLLERETSHTSFSVRNRSSIYALYVSGLSCELTVTKCSEFIVFEMLL